MNDAVKLQDNMYFCKLDKHYTMTCLQPKRFKGIFNAVQKKKENTVKDLHHVCRTVHRSLRR